MTIPSLVSAMWTTIMSLLDNGEECHIQLSSRYVKNSPLCPSPQVVLIIIIMVVALCWPLANQRHRAKSLSAIKTIVASFTSPLWNCFLATVVPRDPWYSIYGNSVHSFGDAFGTTARGASRLDWWQFICFSLGCGFVINSARNGIPWKETVNH